MKKNLLITSSILFSITTYGQTEREEQISRMPHKVPQAEVKKLLLDLKRSTLGKNVDPTKISYDYSGRKINGKKLQLDNDPVEHNLIREQCNADETEFVGLESTLIRSWTESWIAKDSKAFTKLLDRKAKVQAFNDTKSFFDKVDTFEYRKWNDKKLNNNSKSINRDIANYLSHFDSIKDFNLTTKKLHVPAQDRAKDMSINRMVADMRFDLRGLDKKKYRRHDRGNLKVTFIKNGKGWKISEINVQQMETLKTNKPAFAEITEISGASKVASYNRIEAIRRGGYALAVGDYNEDGITDMYVGAYGPAQLFKGTKDGRFVLDGKSGIGDHLYVKSAAWADFNNDGRDDLMIVRFVPNKSLVEIRNTDLLIYENLGKGKFKNTGKVFEKSPTDYAMPSAVADFNNDGLLDFYVGYPGHKDFSTLDADFEFKKKLKAQGVYINKGSFKFAPESMSADATKRFEEYSVNQQIFPHSAVAVDFNQDRNVDILVIDDRGNLSPVYVNAGNGKFVQGNRNFGVENYGYGMGIASGDINNDGLTDLFMTNVRFHAKDRIMDSCVANWDVEALPSADNRKNRDITAYLGTKLGDKKKFIESAKSMGLDNLGDGLAALELVDYNNDGHLDIYVANGLWSGTDRYEDLASYFSRAQVNEEKVFNEARSVTQSRFMDILSNYRGDIFGNEKKKSRLSLGGFQRNRLFRNNGNGTFMEVGFIEGVDSIADGYIISKADINRDGRVDLILRNGDPGSDDIRYAPVQVYKNNHHNKNSLRLKLIGSESNRNAIGSEVVVKTKDGLMQTQQVIANNGTAQSEITLHFGIGQAKVVESILVKWPKGQRSLYKDIKPGYLELKETDLNNRISSNN